LITKRELEKTQTSENDEGLCKTRNNVSKLDRTHSISEVLKLGRSRNNDIKLDRARNYTSQLDRTQLELEVPKLETTRYEVIKCSQPRADKSYLKTMEIRLNKTTIMGMKKKGQMERMKLMKAMKIQMKWMVTNNHRHRVRPTTEMQKRMQSMKT
jgi:hypothetical protein